MHFLSRPGKTYSRTEAKCSSLRSRPLAVRIQRPCNPLSGLASAHRSGTPPSVGSWEPKMGLRQPTDPATHPSGKTTLGGRVGTQHSPCVYPGRRGRAGRPAGHRGPRPTAGVETPPHPPLAASQRRPARPQAPPGPPHRPAPRQRHPRRFDAAGGDARGGAASGWRHPPGSAPPPWSRRVRRVSGGC